MQNATAIIQGTSQTEGNMWLSHQDAQGKEAESGNRISILYLYSFDQVI